MRRKTHPRKKRKTKKPNKIFGFFYQYWITIILIVVLATLIRQNFLVNNFPNSLIQKQKQIDQNIKINNSLTQQNTIKKLELEAKTAADMEALESQARYRFGLIKEGETYYQINELVPNSP